MEKARNHNFVQNTQSVFKILNVNLRIYKNRSFIILTGMLKFVFCLVLFLFVYVRNRGGGKVSFFYFIRQVVCGAFKPHLILSLFPGKAAISQPVNWSL